MHSTGSFLYSVLEKSRFILEEPTADSQYNDAFIARQVIPSAHEEIMNAIRLSTENPILFRLTIPIVSGTEYYLLPPAVQQIWRLGKIDDQGTVTNDWFPRGEFSPMGRGWSIEANMLSFSPIPQTTEDWLLWYVPSADFMCHYGTGAVSGTARDKVVLAAAPTLGILDRRPNAYAGAVLRILHSGVPWQERVISAYDVATRIATVRIPFATTSFPTDGAAITYEVAPIGHLALWNCVAYKVAFDMGIARNVSEKKLALIEANYRRALKSIRDKLANIQAARGKGWDNESYNNRSFTEPAPW